MRNLLFGVVTAVVLLPIGILGYIALGFTEIRSDLKPSMLESVIMGSAVRASVRRGAAGIPNAATANHETLIAGGKLYVAGCAGCHGELEKPFREDHDHFPPVPQLPYLGTHYSESELYWIVKHGIRMSGMSAYGRFYSEQQLWALSAFVYRIKKLSPDVVMAVLEKKD
jgi:mono/diheme cytochrome c family protein